MHNNINNNNFQNTVINKKKKNIVLWILLLGIIILIITVIIIVIVNKDANKNLDYNDENNIVENVCIFNIEGNNYSFPLKLGVFLDKGYDIKSDFIPMTIDEWYNDAETFLTIINKNKIELNINVIKDGAKLEDLKIEQISFQSSVLLNNDDFTLNGLKLGTSTYDDAVRVFGEPDNVSINYGFKDVYWGENIRLNFRNDILQDATCSTNN